MNCAVGINAPAWLCIEAPGYSTQSYGEHIAPERTQEELDAIAERSRQRVARINAERAEAKRKRAEARAAGKEANRRAREEASRLRQEARRRSPKAGTAAQCAALTKARAALAAKRALRRGTAA